MKPIRMFLLAVALSGAATLQAKITLPSVISDHMVLQRETDAALWGTADKGRKVTVKTSWDNKAVTTTADRESGKWLVRVKTPEAGGPYEITISDGEAVTLSDVLIGDVWYCSGQSNMEMPVRGFAAQPVRGNTEAILRAKTSRPIRLCRIQRKSSPDPQEQSSGSWQLHSPQAVAEISATAYFFADLVQECTGIPIGILETDWGGSSIQTWIRRDWIEKYFPGEFDLGYLDGKAPIKDGDRNFTLPCLLYNGQVNPLVPYTFKGMLWYQGETNRSNPDQYVRLQEVYVQMMREIFGAADAPFYFVQIAPYAYSNGNSWQSGYFYEAQQKTLKTIPRSGMAVTCDIGEYGTIHPCRKQEVGRRLAYLALKHDYGFNVIEADPPTYKSVTFADGKAIVQFDGAKNGLNPMRADISGFEIAGADKVFRPATARLDSKDRSAVDVSSPEVSEPVAVRYCFRNWCTGGLYNNFGVPAAPFRTDSWTRDEVPFE